jgi:hypothetical protein
MSRFFAALFLVGAVAASSVAVAQDSETFIKPGLLFQGRWDVKEDGNPKGDGFGNDLYIKRTRFILTGGLTKYIKFFAETDISPSSAVDGKPALFLQDAVVSLQFTDKMFLDIGLVLPSFSHHNKQGATSLFGLDYMNFYSAGFPVGLVWRDVGAEFRATFLDKINVRLGMYQGVRGTHGDADPLNPSDIPRFVLRATYNFFDVEDGIFYGGIHHGKKKILSVGVAADIQPDSIRDKDGKTALYKAFAADVYVDYPMNDALEIVGQLNFLYFDRGYDGANYMAGSGMGAILEGGFRWNQFGPMVAVEWFDHKDSDDNTMNFKVGGAYWLKGNNANFKLEYGSMSFKGADRTSQLLLQFQFLYL